MKFFRKLMLVWMICWLPAAGALAAIMPLSASMVAVTAAEGIIAGDQDVSAMPCHGKALSERVALGQGCTHCVLCHLAGALVMPEMPVIAELLPLHVFTAITSVTLPSFVPELISPPPRTLAV